MASQAGQELRLQVAGVEVVVESEHPSRMVLSRAFRKFLVPKAQRRRSTRGAWRLRLEPPPFPPLDPERLLFDTDSHWSVFEVDGGTALVNARASVLQRIPEIILLPGGDSRFGRVFHVDAATAGARFEPLASTMGQLLWRAIFPASKVVLLHAAGIIVAGKAYVFVGHSGAGKSTFLRQFSTGIKLSDDRVALRRVERGGSSKWWAFGTPWPGEDDIVDPGCAPLASVFLLVQAPRNALVPIRGAEAVAEITARLHPPFWSDRGMVQTMELMEDLVARVPCFRFEFVPGPEAVKLALDRL